MLSILLERLHEMYYHVLFVLIVRTNQRDGRVFGLVMDFQNTPVVQGEYIADKNVCISELGSDAPAQMQISRQYLGIIGISLSRHLTEKERETHYFELLFATHVSCVCMCISLSLSLVCKRYLPNKCT